MSDVTLKIDADTAAYIAKIAKMAEAHEGVNSKLKDHGKFADHLTHGLERALFKAIALKEIAQAISESFKQASEKAAEINKKESDFRGSAATALTTIGFGGEGLEGALSVLEQEGGRATEQQRLAFTQRLAQEQARRRQKNLPLITGKQYFEAQNAYRQGGDIAFGQGGEELSQIFTDPRYGYGVGQDINARANAIAARRFNVAPGIGGLQRGLDTLPEDIRTDDAVNMGIMENERRARRAARAVGPAARLAESAKDYNEVERPVWHALHKVGNATSLGIEGVIYQKSLEAQERENKLNERRTIREDAHDEGKK